MPLVVCTRRLSAALSVPCRLRCHPSDVSIAACPFEIVVIDHGGYYQLSKDVRLRYAELWAMMAPPRDEAHRLRRRSRLIEILDGWGVGHPSRFVIEQMLMGNMAAADATASVAENGKARAQANPPHPDPVRPDHPDRGSRPCCGRVL